MWTTTLSASYVGEAPTASEEKFVGGTGRRRHDYTTTVFCATTDLEDEGRGGW